MYFSRQQAQKIRQMSQSCSKVLGVLLGMLLSLPGNVTGNDQVTIYFYSSEATTSRNTVMKSTFDEYFASHSAPTRFQPVADRDTFTGLFGKQPNSLYIMASWQYAQLAGSDQRAQPILIGEKNGKRTYQKLLISKQADLNWSAPLTVATSIAPDVSRRLLQGMLPDANLSNLTHVSLLEVPKDVDALMAVRFGLAPAALTTDYNLAKMRDVYGDQVDEFHVINASPPLLQLMVIHINSDSAPLAHSKLLEATQRALMTMHDSFEGRLGLSLLGLDKWQMYDTDSDLPEGGAK